MGQRHLLVQLQARQRYIDFPNSLAPGTAPRDDCERDKDARMPSPGDGGGMGGDNSPPTAERRKRSKRETGVTSPGRQTKTHVPGFLIFRGWVGGGFYFSVPGKFNTKKDVRVVTV